MKKSKNTDEYKYKALATVASALLCGFLIYVTKGKHGAGWFILSLIFIWGC